MPDNSVKKTGKFKAAVLNWLGVPITPTSEFWAAWAGSLNTAGQTVNENTILSLSAAWACTKLISETAATLPLTVYRRTQDGREEAKDHPLYPVLHVSPNAKSTPATFFESNVAAMLLRGNGFAKINRVGGRIVSLDFLRTAMPNLDSNNNFVGVKYTDNTGKEITLPLSQVLHFPNFSMDGTLGLSTICYGASVFGSALAANDAANSTFENGLAPTVAFTIERILKPEQREEARESIRALAGAINAGKSPLLEGGMKAETIGIPPKDAQLLESRSFSVEEVCRWFGVDPSMVGHGGKDSNWGTGLEQKMIYFLTFTMRPLLTRIEQRINKTLLSPDEQLEYYVEYNIEGLLRADSTARAAFYQSMVNNGIFTRDEVRQKENKPMMGGNAAKLTVQGATVTLDSLGQNNEQT